MGIHPFRQIGTLRLALAHHIGNHASIFFIRFQRTVVPHLFRPAYMRRLNQDEGLFVSTQKVGQRQPIMSSRFHTDERRLTLMFVLNLSHLVEQGHKSVTFIVEFECGDLPAV